MIVVTGATGLLGSQIVERLLDRVPPGAVGVSVRDPRRARSLAERGVRVRRGDFTDPDSLRASFDGADQVLVVSAAIRGAGAVVANTAAVTAAHAAGAGRILYTSHQAASRTSLFGPAVTHALTEEHLGHLGVPFTALRNGFYANTLGYFVGDALRTGRLALPDDGPVSWTAHADLAEAAAAALTDGAGLLDEITAPLTAAEALTFTDVAAIVSDITGRTIERVTVDDDRWRATAISTGMPAPAADFTLGMFRAARAGEFAATSATLQTVTGHPPRTARSFLEAALADTES